MAASPGKAPEPAHLGLDSGHALPHLGPLLTGVVQRQDRGKAHQAFHLLDPVLDPDNTNILTLAKRVKEIDYSGYVSLEIIKGENLPESLLKETATRLRGYIAQA